MQNRNSLDRCSNSLRRSPRHAFMLIELVVVLVVIGIIVAITIPAVSSARESSRLSTCLNNLRQQGLAMLQSEQAHKIVPHAGGPTGVRDANNVLLGSTITARDGSQVVVSITYAGHGRFGYFPLTLGNPRASAQEQTGPWCYAILPYLDEKVAFDQVNFKQQQPVFLCPNRGRTQMIMPVGDELFTCESGGWAWARSDDAVVFKVGYRLCGQPLSKFEPYGTDKLVLIGEKAMDPFIQTRTSWLYDEPMFTASVHNIARGSSVGRGLYPDGEGAEYMEGFGSPHPSGVNFTFFSARTQTIDFDIDQQVWEEMNPPIRFDEIRVGPPVLE